MLIAKFAQSLISMQARNKDMNLLRRQNRVQNPSPYYRNVLTLSQGIVLDQVTNDGRKVRGILKVSLDTLKNYRSIQAGVRYSMDSWNSQHDVKGKRSESVHFQGSVVAVFHFSIKWPNKSFMGILEFALYVADECGHNCLWDNNSATNYVIYQQERLPPSPHPAGFRGSSPSIRYYSPGPWHPELFDISKAFLKSPNLVLRSTPPHEPFCKRMTECANGDCAIRTSSDVDTPSPYKCYQSTGVNNAVEPSDRGPVEDDNSRTSGDFIPPPTFDRTSQSDTLLVLENYRTNRSLLQMTNYTTASMKLANLTLDKLPNLLIRPALTLDDSTCRQMRTDNDEAFTTSTMQHSIIPTTGGRSAIESNGHSDSVLVADNRFSKDNRHLDSHYSGGMPIVADDSCGDCSAVIVSCQEDFEADSNVNTRYTSETESDEKNLPRPKRVMSRTVKKAITSPIQKIRRFVRNRRSRSLDNS